MVIQDIFRADCHIHTTCSDGSFSPTDVITEAKSRGLGGMSITDHDTVMAYQETLPIAHSLGIKLLPGAELSAFCDNTPIHILAFGFDLKNQGLLDLLTQIQSFRVERTNKIFEKLQKCGFDVQLSDISTVSSQSIVTRSHIAQLLVDKGYVKDVQTVFKKYLGDKARAYVPLKKIPVFDVIQTIHQANGKAILAHPHKIKNKKILKKVLDEPFDGLEGHYGILSQKQEQPFVQIAKEKNWIVTGGSDFHGQQNYLKIGASWTNQDTFEPLYRLAMSNNPDYLFTSSEHQ